MIIRELRDEEAGLFVALRKEALLDAPLSFAASPGDDFASTSEAVRDQLRRAPDWVILGAFEDGLVGTVGLFRDRHLKSAHKVHIWGMYVSPGHRAKGVAAALLQAAVDHARGLSGVAWVQLSVSSSAPAALRLYERAGFLVWGTEPDALRHAGRSVDEHHLAFRLE